MAPPIKRLDFMDPAISVTFMISADDSVTDTASRVLGRCKRTTPPQDPLAANVRGDCWTWTGATSKFGYGSIRVARSRRTVLTHRAVLMAVRQVSNLDIDHLCRNPACCNPDHLEQVDRLTNVRRGAAAACYRNGVCPRCGSDDIRSGSSGQWCRPCTNARARQRYAEAKKGGGDAGG